MPGFVYFIGEEPLTPGGGLVKVGWAEEPRKRLHNLQCGNPRGLRLLATTPAERWEEAKAHEALRERRVRGEWFHLSAVMLFGLGLGDLRQLPLDVLIDTALGCYDQGMPHEVMTERRARRVPGRTA